MRKVRKADPRDGWYLLEPIDAQGFLDGQPPNRTLRESKAVRFSKDIDAGKWRPNGEPLILDENNKLLDGQGRCRAVVLAGKGVETYVVHGIPRKFFTTVDTGQARTGADTLGIAGFKHYAVISAVAKIALTVARGSGGSQKTVTNDDVKEWARKNAGRLDAALAALAGTWSKSPLPASILTYIYLEAVSVRPEKALPWAVGVALGENLPGGSPMLVLRNQLLRLKGEQHTAKPGQKLAWAIKSWNAFAAGRTVTLFKWTPRTGGKNAEPFPVIVAGDKE